MRNLIKKILIEEFFTQKTIVEKISFYELKKYLILTEGIATVKIDVDKENDVLDYIESHYNQINPNNGDEYYYDTNSKMGFTIEPSDHWLQRLDRKKEPEYENNPNIVDPTTTEGIDLLFSSMSKITNYIQNFNWSERVICLKLITFNNDLEYTNLIKIQKNFSGKRLYDIIMVTQLKGEKFNEKKYQKCNPIKN